MSGTVLDADDMIVNKIDKNDIIHRVYMLVEERW